MAELSARDIAAQLRKLEPNDGSYCRLVPGEKMDIILYALDLAVIFPDLFKTMQALQGHKADGLVEIQNKNKE